MFSKVFKVYGIFYLVYMLLSNTTIYDLNIFSRIFYILLGYEIIRNTIIEINK